jgi:tetratricopeptide (TPR) repeat protein
MKKTFANLLIASCLASPAFAQSRGANGPLDAARELYASARYDEALAMLDGLRSSDRRSIEQYRLLCLLALGRTPEAEAAIAAVVTADPTFQPSEADASPRVRAAFTEVRQRLLPDIAAAHYAAAKATYDRKEWAAAERQFRDLLALLNDRAMAGRLGDLRTLVSGFLDLATAAAAPPPAPPKPEPAPAPAPAPAPPPPQPAPNKVYGGEDAGVTPPVVIRQDIPAVPSNITSQVKDRGRVELVIDEQGRVVSMNLRVPMHPFYDQLVIGAAKDWRYKPATLNGVPVKFRKLIAITLAR